jgi:hypothetical protein
MNMKSTHYIFFSTMLAAICTVSCNKQPVIAPANATTVGISKVIFYPAVSIIGDKIITITEGSAFTDPGVTAILNGKTTPVVTTPTISATTPAGVYTVTYTASNPQGYTASDWRYVVVVPASALADHVVAANDFSGTYLRAATGVTSTWTKISTGVYQIENAGGAATGVGLISVLVNFSGNNISIPTQDDPNYGGTISTSGAVYSTAAPATYSWVLNAPGYGTGVRTFVMQ